MKISHSINKQNIGNAGEYYIAFLLSSQNLIVSITLGRAEKYDIIAYNPLTDKTIKISVKTRYEFKVERFPLNVKDEMNGKEDFYYAFVNLNEMKCEPDYWIIPSKRLNEILKFSSNKYFNEMTNKEGGKYNDVGIRNIWMRPKGRYKELYAKNWEEELEKYYKNCDKLKL